MSVDIIVEEWVQLNNYINRCVQLKNPIRQRTLKLLPPHIAHQGLQADQQAPMSKIAVTKLQSNPQPLIVIL